MKTEMTIKQVNVGKGVQIQKIYQNDNFRKMCNK